MLKQLIRDALERRGLSMRRASLKAGQSESYVRDILEGKVRDPGIAGILSLAQVLRIPTERLIEAVQRNLTIRGIGSSREAATRIIGEMTPEELATFIASRGKRPKRRTKRHA